MNITLEDIKTELFDNVRTGDPVFMVFRTDDYRATIATHDGHINGQIGWFSVEQQTEIIRIREKLTSKEEDDG